MLPAFAAKDTTGYLRKGCSPAGPVHRARQETKFAMKKNALRAVIEIAFIIFLFYSNLLMGEFERSGMGQRRGLVWAIGDVLSTANFENCHDSRAHRLYPR